MNAIERQFAGIQPSTKTNGRDCMRGICGIAHEAQRRLIGRSLVLFQPPELITRQLDGCFYSRPREPVRRMLIGSQGTLGAPGAVVLWQLASGRITGKCMQIGSRFRYEHVNLH
jgi:hypothetical protein